MLAYLKTKFKGLQKPEKVKENPSKSQPQQLSQKLIDIRDDIYNIIKDIKDPEFNNTLLELKVVSYEDIDLIETKNIVYVKILWTPTVEHCKFASHIGLSIRLKLQQELMGYDSMKLDILIKDDKHQDFKNLNKQINDKERYFAAQENPDLMSFISNLIQPA